MEKEGISAGRMDSSKPSYEPGKLHAGSEWPRMSVEIEQSIVGKKKGVKGSISPVTMMNYERNQCFD